MLPQLNNGLACPDIIMTYCSFAYLILCLPESLLGIPVLFFMMGIDLPIMKKNTMT
jgi:hypothetical protein